MKEHVLLNFYIPGYKLATSFCCKRYLNGGVCILEKDNISFQVLDLHNKCKEKFSKHVEQNYK
jgi:hypothetical protein